MCTGLKWHRVRAKNTLTFPSLSQNSIFNEVLTNSSWLVHWTVLHTHLTSTDNVSYHSRWSVFTGFCTMLLPQPLTLPKWQHTPGIKGMSCMSISPNGHHIQQQISRNMVFCEVTLCGLMKVSTGPHGIISLETVLYSQHFEIKKSHTVCQQLQSDVFSESVRNIKFIQLVIQEKVNNFHILFSAILPSCKALLPT